jgi:DNA (cytosine-5)-methyltransferase 1
MGLDLGLESVGIETKLACDFDPSCRKTIQANKPLLPVLDDILNYSTDDILELADLTKESIDLIVGGPPCQAFSTAGKRQAFNDPRGNVFLHFINLIEQIRPKYIVIENVRGLLSASLKHKPHSERGKSYYPSADEMPGSALLLVIHRLESIGYNINFNLYNAANYGVPQKRERVVIIGTLSKTKVQFLQPTNSNLESYGLPNWKTFKEATAGLIKNSPNCLTFPEKRLRFYRMLKPGQYWKHLPNEEIKKEALGKSYFSGGGKTGFLRRISWDSPAPTLVTHPAMPATDLCHPCEDRPLSVEEYMRIQQFPDDWIIEGSLLNKYKQLGNAVPVGLGKAIGKAILEHRSGKAWNEDNFTNFNYSRYKNTSYEEWLGSVNSKINTPKNYSFDFNEP